MAMEKLICDVCHGPFQINRDFASERISCPYCSEHIETDLIDDIDDEESDIDMTEDELIQTEEPDSDD